MAIATLHCLSYGLNCCCTSWLAQGWTRPLEATSTGHGTL